MSVTVTIPAGLVCYLREALCSALTWNSHIGCSRPPRSQHETRRRCSYRPSLNARCEAS